MNKKYLKYGVIAAAVFLVIFLAFFSYAYVTLKREVEKQGEVKGFKLFLDGIVINEFKINSSITLKRVYLHGNLFEMLFNEPEYLSIHLAEINADSLLTGSINWPFTTKNVEVENLKITKTIMQKNMVFLGFAKQSDETPLLIDATSDDNTISGKAEIRMDNNQIQMIDIDLAQADVDFLLLKTKRGSGWLSFSYEDNWQIVSELDAGITLLGPYQFFDSTIKISGPVTQPDMTFSGQMDQQNIVIDRQQGNYFVRQNDKTLPVIADQDALQEIILTLDKAKILQEHTKIVAKPEPKKDKPKSVEPAKPTGLAKEELPPPIAFKIQPVALPLVKLEPLTANTSLAGFTYSESVVQINQPCVTGTGQCWVAHGQGGKFTYNPELLPTYFMQLKDYEQSKQLRGALVNFNVQSITVNGKDKTAQQIILKGTTAQNQPAEIQLSVLGLE